MSPIPEPSTVGLSPFKPMERHTGCLVQGCDAKHLARGLCRHHYRVAYYRLNATRSKAQTKLWRAQNRPQPEVSQHPVHGTDVSTNGCG